MQSDSGRTRAQVDNRLLAALPKGDQRQILSHCDPHCDQFHVTHQLLALLWGGVAWVSPKRPARCKRALIHHHTVGIPPCSTAPACKAPPAAVKGPAQALYEHGLG